jgi:hypothetical protein
MFIFYCLLIAGLFIFPQHLNPQKKKIIFFESTYSTLENKDKFSYYDEREADIPPIILQRYGNKQINSEFLTYSLFEHHKPIVVLFPQSEIFDAFENYTRENANIEKEMFSYKEVESMAWYTDSILFTESRMRGFNWYIPVNPSDSVCLLVERNGSRNGFVNLMGYDDRRIPQFVMWSNFNTYYDSANWDGKWEKLYINCLVPEKTKEIRIYIDNSVRGGIDTICFRNLKVSIKRSGVKF